MPQALEQKRTESLYCKSGMLLWQLAKNLTFVDMRHIKFEIMMRMEHK